MKEKLDNRKPENDCFLKCKMINVYIYRERERERERDTEEWGERDRKRDRHKQTEQLFTHTHARARARACVFVQDVQLKSGPYFNMSNLFTNIYMLYYTTDRLCALVVRVSGFRYRGPGFDSRRYQIF